MKYFIKYGEHNNIIEVTDYFMKHQKNNIIYIFPDDTIRGQILSDPCIYILKQIIIFTDEGDFFIITHNDYAYIDLNDNMLYINTKCPRNELIE